VKEPSLETRLETGDPAPEPTVPLTPASLFHGRRSNPFQKDEWGEKY